MKKIVALGLAAIMVMALCGAAFAATENYKVKVGGLQDTDTVYYGQIIKWDNTTAAWVWNTDVVTTGGTTGLTEADLAEVVGDEDTQGAISLAMAKKIAANIKSTELTTGGSITSNVWTSPDLTSTGLGLYFVQVVPTEGDVLYNPVFLPVNAPTGAGSEGDMANLTYADGTTKKQTTDVTKTAKDKNDKWVHATDENVGDVIEFKVETTLPVFLDNYTNPMFTVSDTMSDGLEYQDGSLKVKIGTNEYTASTADVLEIEFNTNGKAWVVAFDADYLKGIASPTDVTIEYQAKITDAAKNVNPETNTATIEYSHNPQDADDHGTKDDETKHYTFGLDIGMQGNEQYTTSEFVKVGKDAAGNYITEEVNSYSNMTTQHPLAGARFLLKDKNGNDYTNNTTIKDGAPVGGPGYFETDATGRFPISGLEAGEYSLVEIAAPAGYKKAEPTAIVITAVYDDTTDPTKLTSYSVTIGGKQAAEYTIDAGTAVVESAPATAAEAGDDNTQEIVDTQGFELPSTGGIGTTIFYVSGLVMVLGAAAILVARRKAESEA